MAEKPKGTAKAAKAKQHHPSDDGATEIPVTSHAESPATHDEEAPLDNRGDVNRGAANSGESAAGAQPDLSLSAEERLAKAEERAQDTYDRLLRVSAEFDNYKKRTAREISDIRKYAYEGLCRDLLTVVDNLERAIDAADANDQTEKSVVEGVGMTRKELLKVLEKYHVTPLDSVGEAFDPAIHQAVLQEPSADHPANTILREFQKGYMIRDRLLRPAMVVVSQGIAEPDKTQTETAS